VSNDINLRPSSALDHPAIELLYRAAFPDEDLAPLVRALLGEPDGVLSLVAVQDADLAGHAIFTRCSVEPGGHSVALLGPLCVSPSRHRQGIGSRLVHAGLACLEQWWVSQVLVLGDPTYYGRFGFVPGSPVTPPYALPADWASAWQFLTLRSADAPKAGSLSVPTPWQDRALWTA